MEWNFKEPTSIRIQALNFQFIELIGQQFSDSTHSEDTNGTKINSNGSFVSEEQCDKSLTVDLHVLFKTVNAVTNGLHWISIKHKPYGSLDKKRIHPSDKYSWKHNHKGKRSVKKKKKNKK